MLKSFNIFRIQLLFFVAVNLLPTELFTQGVIVNELSNGNSGGREYIELVAIGPTGSEPCGPVDLRGFIIDDNNGDFSGGPGSNMGIAFGHLRFSPTGPWAAIPAGSILLIYNSADKNTSILLPDDPYDSNNDSVYIIPDSNSNLQRCTTIPNTSNDAYSPAIYSPGVNWLNTNGMRNTGDAAQVRLPNGTFFHGFGFGSAPMNGGPDNIFLSGSGVGKVINFGNSLSNNYRSGSNFSMSVVLGNETPGFGNNAANTSWINWLRTNCNVPLAEIKVGNLYPFQNDWGIEIEWETGMAEGNYVLQKLLPDFSILNCAQEVLRNSSSHKQIFQDINPVRGINTYRIHFTDDNGSEAFSPIAEILLQENVSLSVFPNLSSGMFQIQLTAPLNEKLTLMACSVSGEILRTIEVDSWQYPSIYSWDLSNLSNGIYFLSVKEGLKFNEKIIIQK